ncbi:VOC family protein [Streptomyces lavendulae]|uniref:VOC family protein n=1 Tax=Streptomyces lavendulae TaxID=1914 RepID=UPI0033F53AFC
MDVKLELVAVPVTDVDRAKAFYERIGFHADHDVTVSEEIRFVQLTPPGSACSIAIGKGLTRMIPGSLDNMQVVVADIEEAYADLRGRGVRLTCRRQSARSLCPCPPPGRRSRRRGPW